MIMMDADYSPAGVKRRLKEEFARHGIDSETEAARRYDVPQQWLSRRMTGETEWKLGELPEFCEALGLYYPYVAAGVRPLPPHLPAGYENGGVTGGTVSQMGKRRRPNQKPVGVLPAPYQPAKAA